MSFIFVSSEPVFLSPDAKKGWLLVVVAAFGHTFNSNSMKSEEVIVSDNKLMAQRVAYRLPAHTARKLQRQIKNNEIDLETMYQRVLDALQVYTIQN